MKEQYDYRVFEYNTSLGRFISFKRIKDIVRQLRIIKPDIVHYTGLQLSGFHIAVACRIAGIKKTIVVIHGSSTEAIELTKMQRIVMYLLESLTLLLASTFYGVSKYASLLRVAKPHKEKSSGYVYNLPIKFLGNNFPFTREDFGLKNDDIVIISVGRITKDKGYHILTQSIKKLKNRKNIKFLIVGSGNYLTDMKYRLEAQVNARQIQFLGYRDDVSKILPICDIFVLPTLHETLSIALLEASYFGLALVASNVGGVPEIIEQGKNGILTPPSDSKAITAAMIALSEDKTLRENMGKNAKEILDEKFSENSIVVKIDRIYKKLLSRK